MSDLLGVIKGSEPSFLLCSCLLSLAYSSPFHLYVNRQRLTQYLIAPRSPLACHRTRDIPWSYYGIVFQVRSLKRRSGSRLFSRLAVIYSEEKAQRGTGAPYFGVRGVVLYYLTAPPRHHHNKTCKLPPLL